MPWGEAAGTGDAGFPSRFRQQGLDSLRLGEAEKIIALTTAVLWLPVSLCTDGQRLHGFNVRAEMPETAPVIRSLSRQRCENSHWDTPSPPFPKPFVIRRAGKWKNYNPTH